ncbi:MAG: hypothetical protein MIO88_01005, partial [Methanoregulaceae archaeon]|nr:hypothetical protein [Methanoregulaceae archaeon]
VVVRGGSHELTHVLVKACLAHGVVVQPNCPVKSIIVQNGEARGVVLSDSAVFPGETIMAKKIVSNTTVHPTFLDMVGREHLGDMAPVIDRFSYDEQNLYTVHFALGGAPRFASADFDDGIQSCYMGYFGGEDSASMKRFAENISMHRRIIHDEIIGNYFITTLADPLQAPPGCHTSHVWFDVPPEPVAWRDEKLSGMKDWDRIKERLADEIEETYERYAPGFKKLVRDRIVYTPLDQYRNNMAAVKGNWAGGSMIPEQFYDRRPLPGILHAGSATRSFIRNLHLSNSIHVASNSTLAPGYLAATEVAEDLGARDHDWWQARACSWYLKNQGAIPSNLGVK